MRRFRYPRKSFTARPKLTVGDLRKFGKKFSGKGKTLVVFIEFPHEGLFEEADVMPRYETKCERYYPLLAGIENESYDQIIAMGLVEHLKEPRQLMRESHRILRPGGKLFLSASSVFSVHRGPDDYFHLTRFGMKEVMEVVPWTALDIRGSCGPFKTMGILLQRILLQCETRFFIRPLTYLLAVILPTLDRFVIKQYCDRSFSEESRIDSMMPSNIQVVATK